MAMLMVDMAMVIIIMSMLAMMAIIYFATLRGIEKDFEIVHIKKTQLEQFATECKQIEQFVAESLFNDENFQTVN